MWTALAPAPRFTDSRRNPKRQLAVPWTHCLPMACQPSRGCSHQMNQYRDVVKVTDLPFTMSVSELLADAQLLSKLLQLYMSIPTECIKFKDKYCGI